MSISISGFFRNIIFRDPYPDGGHSVPFGQAAVVNEDGCTGSPARDKHPRGRYAAYTQSAMFVGLVSASKV